MQKIVPHLWYDKEAVDAANFYVATFGGDSKVTNINKITGTPSGDCDIVSFELHGVPFMAISAGPYFKFTPAISFLAAYNTKEEIDALWAKLSEGGKVMMELGEYPFSKHYGWLQDKYGLSWQLIHAGDGEIKQPIMPMLLFVGAVSGKAEEASRFYASIFPGSNVGYVLRYKKGEEPEKEGTAKYVSFSLMGNEFRAMDSAYEHKFAFNEAVSFIVNCEDQKEIDNYWEKLSAVPESEQCGWLKDKYGVSWQIVPTAMNDMMATKDKAALQRVTEAFLKMKKFDIAELDKAFKG